MATCIHCGHEIPEEAQFCPNCGRTVASSEAAPEEPASTEEAQGIDQEGAPVGPDTVQVSKDTRTVAMLCHLSAFAGYLVPMGNIAGPLLVWLLKREESPFIDFHGKESVNFQISVFIYFIVSLLLMFVLIGFLLLPILVVFELVVVILAAVRANDGQEYRYPLSIRFIK